MGNYILNQLSSPNYDLYWRTQISPNTHSVVVLTPTWSLLHSQKWGGKPPPSSHIPGHLPTGIKNTTLAMIFSLLSRTDILILAFSFRYPLTNSRYMYKSSVSMTLFSFYHDSFPSSLLSITTTSEAIFIQNPFHLSAKSFSRHLKRKTRRITNRRNVFRTWIFPNQYTSM